MAPLVHLVKSIPASLSVLHIEKSGGLPAEEVAEKLQAGLVLSKATYTYEMLEHKNVDEGILQYLNRHPADLLAMVAHRHGLMARLFGETHTPHLAFAVDLPLLILKNRP